MVLLGSYINIHTGEQLNKSDMFEKGTYPVINGGIEPSGFVENYNELENTITMSQGGASAGFVSYQRNKFWAGAHCYVIKTKNASVLLDKYLYNILKSKEKYFQTSQQGAGIPSVNRKVINGLNLQIPHLQEQQRIVNILDEFEGMVENVEKELELRQKQYEYYREKIMSSLNSVTCEEISSFTKILRGKRLTKKELSDDNKYPVYHGGIEPIGKYDDYNRKAETVMIINVGASAGTVGFCKEDFWSSDGCFCIDKTEGILDKYLYFFLLGKEHEIKAQVRHAGIPTLDQSVIEKIEVPIVSLETQQQIVTKLDKFEAIIANLKRELELRKKQYEYYREKLLTFE